MRINLQLLRGTDPELYRDLEPWVESETHGFHINHNDEFAVLRSGPKQVFDRIEEWAKTHHQLIDGPLPEQERIAKLAESEKRKLAEERAANAKISAWISIGLLDNAHNAKAISDFIVISAKGKFTPESVDLAIDSLGPKGSNVLQWRPEAAAPASAVPAPAARPAAAPSAPAAPPVTVPQPKLLPNGEPELPLNASESEMHRASLTQLKDLSRRRGEGHQPRLGRLRSTF